MLPSMGFTGTVCPEQLIPFADFESPVHVDGLPVGKSPATTNNVIPIPELQLLDPQLEMQGHAAPTQNTHEFTHSTTSRTSMLTSIDACVNQTYENKSGADDNLLPLVDPTAMNSLTLPTRQVAKSADHKPTPAEPTSNRHFRKDPHVTKHSESSPTVMASHTADLDRSDLGWIAYNQSSFAGRNPSPKPFQVCEGPDKVLKRGRHEPLGKSKRNKIAEMRKVRACLLCKMKKKEV